MPFGVKLTLSFLSAVVLCLLMLVDPKSDNADPHWLWRGERNDSLRNLVCRPDGSLRTHTKTSLAVVWAAWLLILWVFIP
jgi:hypothetical protein